LAVEAVAEAKDVAVAAAMAQGKRGAAVGEALVF